MIIMMIIMGSQLMMHSWQAQFMILRNSSSYCCIIY